VTEFKIAVALFLCTFVSSFFNIKNQCDFFSFLCFLLFLYSCDEPVEPQEDYSLYISDVFRYVYAQGQHAVLALTSESTAFVGNPDDDSRIVYLGGFGGYIIAGFNHNIVNHAVDLNGNPVSLANIRFLKIQSAVFQQAGWLNEVSSELLGAKEIK